MELLCLVVDETTALVVCCLTAGSIAVFFVVAVLRAVSALGVSVMGRREESSVSIAESNDSSSACFLGGGANSNYDNC